MVEIQATEGDANDFVVIVGHLLTGALLATEAPVASSLRVGEKFGGHRR